MVPRSTSRAAPRRMFAMEERPTARGRASSPPAATWTAPRRAATRISTRTPSRATTSPSRTAPKPAPPRLKCFRRSRSRSRPRLPKNLGSSTNFTRLARPPPRPTTSSRSRPRPAARRTPDAGQLTPRGGAAAERGIGVRTLCCRQGDDCPGIWGGAVAQRPQRGSAHAHSCCGDGAMAGRRGKSAGLESAGAAAFAVEHGIVVLRVGVARRRCVLLLRAAAERGERRPKSGGAARSQ